MASSNTFCFLSDTPLQTKGRSAPISLEIEQKGQGNKNIRKNGREDRTAVRAASGRGVRSKLILKNKGTMEAAGYEVFLSKLSGDHEQNF